MAVISIGGFDLYPYTRLLPGDGMDIADTDFIQPNFGDTSSNFGDPLLSIKKNNREVIVPIHLRSANKTKAGLHTILIQLNNALRTGKVLTWQDDGATNSSYLTVQFARFEPEFNKRRQDAGWMSGLVRIFTAPYARSVASGYATVLTASVAATGVTGSVALPTMALSDGPLSYSIQINTPSQMSQNEGRIVGAAILPSGYIADWSAASLALLTPNASLAGASGAAGSQVLALKTFDTFGTAPGIDSYGFYRAPFAQLILTNASAYSGRNRLLGVIKGRNLGVAVSILDDNGFPKTPLAKATSYFGVGFGVVDFGVINVDPLNGATKVINFEFVPNTDAPALSEAGLGTAKADVYLNRVLILPEENTQYVIDDNNRRAIGGMIITPYAGSTTLSSQALIIDDYGNTFSNPVASTGIASQVIILSNAAGAFVAPTIAIASTAAPNSAAVLCNTPTSYNFSAHISGGIIGINSVSGGGTLIAAVGKYMGSATSIISARICAGINATQNVGTYTFQLIFGGLGVGVGNPQVVACAALYNGSTSLNGYYRIRLQQRGPVINALACFEATYGVFRTATLVGSVFDAALPGVGILGLNDTVQNSYIKTFGFSEVPSTGLTAGDAYVLDGENQTAYRGVGQNYNLARSLRNKFIEHDPDPTQIKSSALVPFILPLDNEAANLNWSYQVNYNEHFTYAVI